MLSFSVGPEEAELIYVTQKRQAVSTVLYDFIRVS
jgi:hypothetical protein